MLSYDELMKKYGNTEKKEKAYGPAPATSTSNPAKKAEKSAFSLRSPGTLRSQGQAVDVVRDTGLKKAVGTLREQAKAPKVKINTDKGFTVQNTTVNPRIGWAAADMTKSTAKDEKTRLYETNDSLLNSGEIIKKYQYVAQDKDMDYTTLRRAVNKGMSEVGRTLRGTNDNSRFETVAKLQTQLQGRLKSASFTAGLLDAMGGDIRDIVAKASGNEGMQKWNEDWHKQIEETKANHPAAATLGAFTGEAGKAAAGYMTIGQAAEKAALAGVGKLNGGKTMGKAGAFATRMLGQQAADTAVDTPITIAAGLAEGKSRGEIGKDVAKQLAMDAAFNVGLEGVGAAARAVKNASRKGPIAGIDFEKIGYDNAVPDEGLIRFQQDVLNGKIGKKAVYPLTEPSRRIVQDIRDLTGIDVSEFRNRIKANAVDHVEKRHGKKGQQDHSMANAEDFAKMEYILNDYDTVTLGDKKGGGYRNSDGSPAQKVLFSKRINGTYYVVEAVPDSKEKTLDIVSVFKSNSKQKKVAESFDANRPQVTSKNVSQQLSSNSILLEGGNVKAEELGNIQKGNRLEQAERNSKKKKGYQGPDVTSPRRNVQNALDLPSTNSIAQEGGNVKETGLTRRNLLPEEKISESLRQEYRDMNDPNYMDAQLRRIRETYGDDGEGIAREMNRLTDRREELEEMLGIRTKKVKDTEKRIYAEATKEIKKMLSLSGKAETEEIRSMIRQATTEGRTGKISQETRERIFNALFDIGRISNRADIDQELKQRLKGLTLRISPRDAANIPDFEQWRKGTFGKIGSVGVDHRGNIDTQWMELNAQWPHLFPDGITNPADQLQRIKAVADEMTYRDIPLAETADAEAKAGIRADFDAAMDRVESNMQKLTAYTNDRAEKQARRLMLEGELPDYNALSTGDVKAIYDERYRLREAAKKARSKKNLTEGDQLALQKLLRGEIDAETARKYAGQNADDLMELYAVEKPLYTVEKSLQGYKERANRKYYDEIADVVGDIHIRSGGKEGWRDLGALRLARETQERILDMIAPNRQKAAQVRKAVFDPIHESERQRSLFKDELIGRVQQLGISTKADIPLKLADGQTGKTSESALVQWLGENRYQLRQMEKKKSRAGAKEIAREQELRRRIQAVEGSISKERLQKIDAAIEEMTEIYKEIHPKINEVLIRNGYEPAGYIEGYFPHMNFDDPDNLLEKAAQKLGFDFASKELPMDISGRTETFRPGKKWSGNLLTRQGKETDYDALRAFDLYLDNISDVIYHTDNIKRLRAYEDYMRYTLSDAGIKEKVDAIRNNMDLPETEKSKLIEEIYDGAQNHSLQNYVNNIRTYTDLLAGKKHKIDRVLETELFGRKVYKVVSEIENRVAGNMVAGNIGSALTNFIPITQGMSSMSVTSNLRGLGEALAYMSKGEMDELTKKSAFLATREGNDLLYKTTMRRISDVAGKPMEWADKFTTQAVWRSRYYDNVAKGMSEEAAIKNADAFARGLFAGRSKGAMPTAFSAKALKPLTMFQLEVNNQISYLLKDIPKEAQGSVRKMMQAYGGIVIGAYIYNDVYEKLTGRRSALDPFSIANEAFGDLTGTQVRNTLDILGGLSEGKLQLTEQVEKKKPSQALEGLAKEVGSNVPFVGGVLFDGGRIPLQSAIPSPTKIIGAMGNIASGDDSAERGLQTIRKEAEKPLWYLGMPVAGGQIRKTMQGLETMAKGGSYNQTNKGPELQFPVDQEKKGQWAKAALFGKWATEGGQKHLEKDRHLGTNQTETYQKLVAAGMKNTLAFETIQRVRQGEKAEDQRKAIRKSLLSEEQKGILYYDLVASDSDKEVLDHFKNKPSMGAAAACLSRIADHKGTSQKRNALRDTDLSDASKEYIYLHKIVADASREKEQTKIAALRQYGIKMDDYLKIKNKFAQIEDTGGKTKAKASEMSQWLSNAGFTSQQQAAIKEQFAFWGMYKQKYK